MKTKLLIFGITGDLGTHRLLPALEQILDTGEFDELSIIGVSRHEATVDSLLENCKKPDLFKNKLSMFSMDVTNLDEYGRLKDRVALTDDEQLLIYLSVPPQAVAQIIAHLGEAGINAPNVKVLFEKPFGTNLASAEDVAVKTAKYFRDDQVYRIDHYLAKEMTQNIVTIRGRNALFSHLWNNQFIQSIEIVASETINIEGRASFYEQTGALRDIVQGHLLQLLALTLLEIPDEFDWGQLPLLRLFALKQIQPVDPKKVIRAQYEGYKEEVNNPKSQVETFVSLELTSNQSKWTGVPIRITTGKALDVKTTEIRIHLKKTEEAQSNCLILRIQPNEGIDIELFIKAPGYGSDLESRHLSFSYPADEKLPDAYEQVIVDAIKSRKSLFTSSEEVLRSWEILQPVQDAWENSKQPIKLYPMGSSVRDILA